MGLGSPMDSVLSVPPHSRFIHCSTQRRLQHFVHQCMWAACVSSLSLLTPASHSYEHFFLLFQIGMMIVSFILHRSVIAMKYAFMSRRRYSAALKSVRGLEINRQEELLNCRYRGAPSSHLPANLTTFPILSITLISLDKPVQGSHKGRDQEYRPPAGHVSACNEHKMLLYYLLLISHYCNSSDISPLQEAEFHVTREAATAHSSIFKFNSVKTLVGEGREAEVYRLNVAHVLTETMDRYCKSLRTFLKPLAPCIALVQSLLPFLVSYFESGVAFGTNGQAIFINIGSAFCSFVYWALVLSFLSVGVLDFKRRHYMQRALTEMIMRSTTISTNTSSIRLPPQSTRSQAATVRSSVTARKVFSFESSATAAASDDFLLRSGPLHLITEDAEGFTPDEAKSKVFLKHSAPWSSFYRSSSMSVRAREKQPSSFPPLIELDTTHNVATWLLMRRVANYLGARYWKRVQLVLAQLFLVTAAVLICVAVALLYPDVLLISLTAQATVGFVCLILLVMTLHTIRWGALTNSQVDWQVAVLNDEQTKIRQLTGIEWLGRRHKRAVQLEYTVWMISSVKKSLKLDVSLNPVQVLGMAASTTMVRTLMATFFPVVMFFVRFALHASSIVF